MDETSLENVIPQHFLSTPHQILELLTIIQRLFIQILICGNPYNKQFYVQTIGNYQNIHISEGAFRGRFSPQHLVIQAEYQ